jgi:aminopeptidase N
VPYTDLNVSQIPGRVGQGYPGLLYLSTFSFLPEDDQIRLGLDEDIRQHFSRIMPAHETAHQWWGNWVWVPDYRSQWLPEALASYSALLYLEDHHHSNNMKKWLEQYRSTLLEESADDLTVESSGALALGARLNSSHNPAGYTSIIYSKGPWVIHMLRELLRDPATGSDAAFVQALRALVAGGGDQPLTTEEFQRGFEAVLPAYADVEGNGRLDWFFQQWVHETGIPRYELEWDLRERPEGGWVAEGLVAQSGVADFFIMPVPVYARFGSDLQRLGSVLVMGEVSAFAFHLDQQPDALVLDPYLTVLSAN